MKKMYLMNGLAVAALALATTSCHKDLGGFSYSEEDALANAELQLGVQIDPNQTWKMTAEATANVTVFKDYGETYTVKVCSSNPMVDDVAYVLAQGTVEYGGTFNQKFTYAAGLDKLYVAVSDSKGYTSVSAVKVENGKVNATFGTPTVAAAPRRSQTAPAVADIDAPYDETWVANYLATAKEPNSTNVTDNYDNTTYAVNYGEGGANSIDWNDPDQVKDRNYFFGDDGNKDSQATRYAWALEHHPNWITFNKDETYVTNFKITGTQNGSIGVVATEDANGDPRTVVVTGTWNLSAEQRVGGGGKIIVANGGKINLASGANLNSVNAAQIVVLPGGEISGEGQIAFCNGTSSDLLSGNWGTVNVGTFNNNGGNFYNYGTLKANKMDGGAGNSRYYNHSVISINETGSSANIRIYNGCQFYVKNNARIRNYEGINGSALIVGGQLMFSSSEDGTKEPTYVGLAGGALIKCATLYNNGTSWSGPTDGYAALEITDKIVYLNWEQDHPEQGGYFENNIYVKAGTWDNVPTGNGWSAGETSTADYKFFSIVANCTEGGNNGVTKVQAGNTQLLPADEDFKLGVEGCTPGFTGDGVPPVTNYQIYSYAFEDTHRGDYDMNDVVLKVQEFTDGEGDNAVQKLRIKLVAIGATLNLNIRLYPAYAESERSETEVAHYAGDFTLLRYNNSDEVHGMLGVSEGEMFNTGWNGNKKQPVVIAEIEKGNYDPAALPIAIYSEAQGEIRLAGAGQAPYGVVIPEDWKWPTERTNIETAYNNTNSASEGNQSFANFASHAGESKNWFKYPTQKVMNEATLGY